MNSFYSLYVLIGFQTNQVPIQFLVPTVHLIPETILLDTFWSILHILSAFHTPFLILNASASSTKAMYLILTATFVVILTLFST